MTDEWADEDELQDALGERLRAVYGDDAVAREVYLPSGRVCDFVVMVPPGLTLAVEVEHNPDPGQVADDMIHGAGQALQYAGELPRSVPVVVSNGSVGDTLEMQALRQRVAVVEWSG